MVEESIFAEDPSAEAPVPESLLRALAANPAQMADLVRALSVPVVDADTLLELMSRVAEQAVRRIGPVHWAGVTAQFVGERPFTTAHTDRKVLIVDEFQYAADDGPCLRAMRTDSEVHMSLSEVAALWPVLARGAETAGVHSFLAVPLHVRDRAVGSLNMYSADVGVPIQAEPGIVTVLTSYLGRGLTRYSDSRTGPAGPSLRMAIHSRALIDQAVGVLMADHGWRPGDARRHLGEQALAAELDTATYAAQLIAAQRPSAS